MNSIQMTKKHFGKEVPLAKLKKKSQTSCIDSVNTFFNLGERSLFLKKSLETCAIEPLEEVIGSNSLSDSIMEHVMVCNGHMPPRCN